MSNKTYYLVKVKESFEDEKGNKKTKTSQKLVSAVSITDSETKVAKLYEGCTFDWEITGSTRSVIEEVID